jgi:hypothetical protein
MKKPVKNNSKPYKLIDSSEKSNKLIKEPESSKEKFKKQETEDTGKLKPLKQEIKNLDLIYSLMMQWAYANYLLKETTDTQNTEAYSQIYDRGKQVIELKKQVSSLSSELAAREKNRLLDDVLSMEYSSLKSVEEDILVSASYLKELEDACNNYLNKLDLGEGVIISPQDLALSLEQTSYTLKKIACSVEGDTNEVQSLASEFKSLADDVKDQSLLVDEISSLKAQIDDLTAQERINVAEQLMPNRDHVLLKILTEELAF